MSTYKMEEPISWNEFKKMPLDIQQRYISNLQSRFQVSAAVIGMDLFGKTPTTVRLHMDKHGIKYSKMQGASMDADKREAWMNWLSPVAPEWAPAKEDPAKVQQFLDKPALPEDYDAETEERMEEDPEVKEVMDGFKDWSESLPTLERKTIKPLSLDELTAVFTGVFNPTAFLQWLAQLPIPEDSVKIKVEVTRE